MLSFSMARRIFIARGATDMRRGIDTLTLMVMNELKSDAYTGDCFVFVSRDRRRLKALVWEDGGFWLCLKRLESGTFPLPRGWQSGSERTLLVSPAQIHALLEGIDVRDARFRKRHRRMAHSTAVSAGSMLTAGAAR